MKVCEEREQTGNFPRVPLEESVIAIVPKHQKNTLRVTESIKRVARFTSRSGQQTNKTWQDYVLKKTRSLCEAGLPVWDAKTRANPPQNNSDWLKRAKSKLSGKRGQMRLLFLAGSELRDCVEILSCSTFTESFLILVIWLPWVTSGFCVSAQNRAFNWVMLVCRYTNEPPLEVSLLSLVYMWRFLHIKPTLRINVAQCVLLENLNMCTVQTILDYWSNSNISTSKCHT